ncbi:MAG: hypothetical protein B7O98_00910 [Zestosphaera tikiterensis]|uniref:AroM family protein n=1 Tax=Zestosphaera tikiterensis TaxID=1973259 RepID=A0A2R7Y904_9CREN|nr:MAG: hypothetical protein B7O98_00910 [Zestosphaera tikiterensis]
MRVGFVTIGQSPRVDVFNDIKHLLPKDIEIIEKGALDNYTEEEINKKLKPRKNETTYITKLKNGKEVKISKNKVVKLVKVKLDELVKEGVDLIVIICSGEFPEYDVEVPVIYPDKLLKGVVSTLHVKGVLGVLIPGEEQIPYMRKRWLKIHPEVEVRAISPYRSSLEDFVKVGRELSSKGVKFVVMDCIGYTLKQKEALKEGLGPNSMVLNTRSIIARVLSELLS